MRIVYTGKLWLMINLLASFIGGANEAFNGLQGNVVGILEVFPITLIFSIVFSIPTLIVVLFVAKLIFKLKFANYLKKLLILALVVLGIIVTLSLIGGSIMPDLIIAYCVSAFLSMLILEIPLSRVRLSHHRKYGSFALALRLKAMYDFKYKNPA